MGIWAYIGSPYIGRELFYWVIDVVALVQLVLFDLGCIEGHLDSQAL